MRQVADAANSRRPTHADDVMTRIVRSATCAVSGDNCQPWRFVEAGPDCLRVELDSQRDPSPLNPGQACSAAAIGAAIENAIEHARGEGLGVGVSYSMDRMDPASRHWPIATLTFSAGHEDRSLCDAIPLRFTNRRKYQRQGIPSGITRTAAEHVRRIPGMTIRFAADPLSMKALARSVRLSDQVVFERRDMRQYLHRMMRWSRAESIRTGDGMPADSLEACAWEQLAMRILLPMSLSTVLGPLGAGWIFGSHGAGLLKHSGGVGLIVGRDHSLRAWVDAGRATSRALLSLTADGIATQPMMSGVLMLNRPFGNRWLDRRHTAMIARAAAVIRKAFTLQPDEVPLFMFRMGYARPPTGISPRRPLASVFARADRVARIENRVESPANARSFAMEVAP